MNIRPRRLLDGSIAMLYGDFLAIECEVYSPPSAAGRTVYVFLDDDDVTDLLRECRTAASRHRTDPDHQPVRWDGLDKPRARRPVDDILADFIKEQP